MIENEAIWGFTGMAMTSLLFIWSMYKQLTPNQFQDLLEKYLYKMIGLFSNSVHIKFYEYISGKDLKKSQTYDYISNYLSSKSTACAMRLKADEVKKSKSLVFSLDDHEDVEDEFDGVKVKWSSSVREIEDQKRKMVLMERRCLTLSFSNKHREMIIRRYLDHVLREGKEIGLKNRERKLYTNYSTAWRKGMWSNVSFDHPATFKTLAMDPEKKEMIKKDLLKFSKGKDYYMKVGKPWKRGYLLFGPPGTGKTTMISAMANFLDYDVYDLELTTVMDNSELKKLMLDTREKSIVVIEDIDCSLDLTGHRRKEEDEDEKEDKKKSKVTLSGILNAIDGLWSACCGEKIIVLTTNFVDKLDPALIRRGRMDKHIEMSCCRFEGFKVLARNYLDVESNDMYGEIERLVEEIDMSPADIAENLMPKSDEEDVDSCLERLVKSLEEEKVKAKRKVESEERMRKKKKAEEEEEKDNVSQEEW